MAEERQHDIRLGAGFLKAVFIKCLACSVASSIAGRARCRPAIVLHSLVGRVADDADVASLFQSQRRLVDT
ncbi:MAG: hypothetical protein IT427_14050 [Pirellulales bacterium]|nr:hypothetical protein [Pirellulales bacterium]